MATDRDTFEAWIKKDCGDLRTFGSGKNMHYLNGAVNNAWTGWQARAALASAPAAVPVYIQSDHLQKARRSPHLCRVEPTQRLPDFVPLYAAPQPAEPAQPAPQAGTIKALEAIAAHDVEITMVDVMDATARKLVEIAKDALAAHPTEQPSQDAARLDWLAQHDGLLCNYDRIIAPVKPARGFLVTPCSNPRTFDSLREAIDAARAAQAQGEKGKA